MGLPMARTMQLCGATEVLPLMTCRCGGPLTLDKSHISEARRFACLATTRLLWKCWLCGHSLWLDQSTTPGELDTPLEVVEAKPA